MFLSEPAASRLPCVVSELALAERRLGGGCLCVCTHPCPPPPAPAGLTVCVCLLSFWECTRDGVDARCVACEFPADVECSAGSPGTSAGTGQAYGQRPLVERPEFLASPRVEATSLWPLGKG